MTDMSKKYCVLTLLIAFGFIIPASAGCKESSSDETEEASSEKSKKLEASDQNDSHGDSEASSKNTESDDDEAKKAEKKENEGTEKSGTDEEDKVKVPDDDLYPGMTLTQLSRDQKRQFLELTKAELCPCPDTAESLDSCLRKKQKQCGIAMRVGALIAQSLKRGLSKTDIMNRVAKYVEAAKKEFDFELSDTPGKGAKDAPVKIIEFADFQCPHCKRAAGVIRKVEKKLEGKVKHYFKNLPLPAHEHAEYAARAAIAAHLQGRFWKMHDLLFKHQKSLSQSKINRFARQIGLDYGKFKEDVGSQKVKQIVAKHKKQASDAKVRKTPTIFINGERYMGEMKVKAMVRAIKRRLQ